MSELSELSEVCRSLSEVCRRLCRRTVVGVCRSLCRTLSGLSEHLGQSIRSSYVGLSELCRNCRTVGLSDCRTSVGRLSAPVGPLSYHLSDRCPTICRTPPLSLSLQLLLHGVTHHLAVLLVAGVGATHAGVLLQVHLGDQLDVRRPGKDIAWCRENSYCKIENKDEGMAKKSRRPIF